MRALVVALACVALVRPASGSPRHPAVATLHFQLLDDDAGTARVAEQFADTFAIVAGDHLDFSGLEDAFGVPDSCRDRSPPCLATIANHMDAEYVVFGSVQRVGHRFHVSTRVFERASGAIRTWFAITTIDSRSLASVSYGVYSELVAALRDG